MGTGLGVGGFGTTPHGSGIEDPPPLAPPDGAVVAQGAELALQTGHVVGGLDLLIEQFKRKDRIDAILRSWLTQVQELEDTFFDLLLKRLNIDGSEGVQLDQIGTIVEEERGGKTDVRYRVFLKARIGINRSKGTVPEILTVMRSILTVAGNPILPDLLYRLEAPASFSLFNESVLLIDENDAAKILGEMTGSGIRSIFEFILQPAAETFAFSDSDVPELGDPLQGFADAGQTTGGKLAGALEGE